MKNAILFVGIALLLGADKADKPANDVKKDLDLFQGTWIVVSLETEGGKVEGDAVKGSKLTVKGNDFTFDSMGVIYKGTFKIDPAKKPKEMDITFTEGPEKGKSEQVLYEVDADTYKLCLKPGGGERPKAFKATDGCIIEVLKREKK
jgi:uncharacterized protein (TIGR03067 family)